MKMFIFTLQIPYPTTVIIRNSYRDKFEQMYDLSIYGNTFFGVLALGAHLREIK